MINIIDQSESIMKPIKRPNLKILRISSLKNKRTFIYVWAVSNSKSDKTLDYFQKLIFVMIAQSHSKKSKKQLNKVLMKKRNKRIRSNLSNKLQKSIAFSKRLKFKN